MLGIALTNLVDSRILGSPAISSIMTCSAAIVTNALALLGPSLALATLLLLLLLLLRIGLALLAFAFALAAFLGLTLASFMPLSLTTFTLTLARIFSLNAVHFHRSRALATLIALVRHGTAEAGGKGAVPTRWEASQRSINPPSPDRWRSH